MPPYRDANRLFYDPVNPVMLSPDQMRQLSPQELQAATDQLDQHLVLILQQIEENFAQCNQVVVESLLPAVEQHGENSMRIYESIKFWRPFFEAAASIRLHEPYADDATSVATEENRQTSVSPDRTVSSAGDRTYSRDSMGSEATQDLEGTPRPSSSKRHHDLSTASSSLPPEPHWSTDHQFASPFLSSNQPDLPANSAMKQPSSSAHVIPDQQLQRLRLRDLPPDSPDVPEPEFETAVFGREGMDTGYNTTSNAGAKGKGREYNLSVDSAGSPSFNLSHQQRTGSGNANKDLGRGLDVPSPRAIRAGGGDKAHSKLLDQILRKNLASPAAPRAGPGSSTPGRRWTRSAGRGGDGTSHTRQQLFPSDLPREWDGIANLSQTNLDAFPSPIKRRQSAASTTIGGEEEEDSFVRMMAAAVPGSTLHRSQSASSYMTSSPAPPKFASSSSSTTTASSAISTAPVTQSSRAALPLPSSSYSTSKPNSSPSKLTRTPAKYAAKLTARNVYESLGLDMNEGHAVGEGGFGSPLPSPPSILRTNHKPFNLHEHTQRQQHMRLSMAPQQQQQPYADEGEGDEQVEGYDLSPTTERTSRIMSSAVTTSSWNQRASSNPTGGPRGIEEPSFRSDNQSYQHQAPSFLGGGQGDEDNAKDISHTQPFDLYQYQLDQRRARAREGGDTIAHGTGSAKEDGGDEADIDDIDDILLGGKTMTFGQERKSLAPSGIRVGPQDLDLGGIVDDDQEGREGGTDRTQRQKFEDEEDELSYIDEDQDRERERAQEHLHHGEQEYASHAGQVRYDEDDDESFNIERGLGGIGGNAGAGGFGNRLLDGPEDTLFGMPQHHPQQKVQPVQPQPLAPYEDEDTFTDTQEPLGQAHHARAEGGARYGAGFRLHGLSEMETLHGGELLASEPFQASPLAGRWGLGTGTGGPSNPQP